MTGTNIEDAEFDLLFVTDLLSVALAATILFLAALAPYTPFLMVLGSFLAATSWISVMSRTRHFRIWFRR